ncbi:MAG: ATP-binding protein, partial [Actinomycetota bacterium]|nr:ATP-binding protein [Actinomycetota bacterium]
LRIRNMLELRELHLGLRRHNEELEDRVRERTVELELALGAEREAARRLRALDEMKNTFLTAVSHELRTPLTSVLGGALTLEQIGSSVSSEERQQLVEAIATNAKKLSRLLADLLDVDRLSRGVMEPMRLPTDLRDLIDSVVAQSDATKEHHVEVEAERLMFNVDAPKLERILDNLLTNAARHTPPGTPVWVKAWQEGEGLVIAVEDAGPGLPEHLRATVFEPFEHGEQRIEHAPGIGIGLSLVSRFAQLHGGRAWVEERPGGGASFRVFVPGRHLVGR